MRMSSSAPSNRAGFLELFLAHQDDLRAFIGALVRDRASRDDVFQEVSVTLWNTFDRYDPNRPFGAWARGVARNRILKLYRKEGRVPEPLAPEAVEATLDAFDALEAESPNCGAWEDALDACLRQLPRRSRKLLALRYEAGHDIGEIATRLRKSTDAVYQALSRIRKQLERCVKARLAETA